MSRPARPPIAFAGMLLAVLVAFESPRPASAAARRPNVLFLFADDWGRYAHVLADIDGAGGINDIVETPHFDRFAREGILFRHAYVNAPSCTPCRSALMSGQYFWRTGRGAILRGAVWDAAIPSWPLLLRDAGYHIGETYKVWSPGTPNDAPYGGGRYGYEQAGRRFNQFSQNATAMVGKGASIDEAKQTLLEEVRRNFRAFLAARPAETPFCYWFGPTNVHRKWIKGSGQALWGIDPDRLQGKMPPFLPDVPEVRQDLSDYFGEIKAWDSAVGLLLDELRRTGEYDNTIVIISGDHGAPGFPHGKCNLYDFGVGVCLAMSGPGIQGRRVVDDFVNLPDLAPTILEAAGVDIPDVMTGRSLWPVLKSDRSGQVDPERTWVVVGRERHVESARAGFLPYPQRAIHTPDHVYVINFKPDRYPLGDHYRLEGDHPPTSEEITEETRVTIPDEDAGPTKAWLVGVRHDPKWKPLFDQVYGLRPREELYDLLRDPHQMHNVAGDPRYESVRRELESRLLAELRRTGDPRLIEDGRFFETPPLAGPVTEPEGKANRKQRNAGNAAPRRNPTPQR